MKKLLSLAIFLISGLVMTSCQSNEEKAQELIRDNFFQTMHDFGSYEPIEIIVKEAKQSMYTDADIWKDINALTVVYDGLIRRKASYNVAAESSYSSKKEIEAKRELFEKHAKVFDVLYRKVKENEQLIDSTKTIGWEVNHKFRCKSQSGVALIKECRFIMNKDFKAILIEEEIGSKESKELKRFMKLYDKGLFEGYYKKLIGDIKK